MKITRDHWGWWVGIAASVLLALTGHFDLLHRAFPAMSSAWDARLELASMIAGIGAGVMRMSPLPISDQGKQQIQQQQLQSSEKAQVAAAVAEQASAHAAKAADAAAAASKVVVTESEKAATPIE